MDVNDPSAAPLPLSGIVKVGFEPSDVMFTLPDTALAAVGLNFTLKLAVCPAERLRGRARPLMLNCPPETLAAEIVTLLPPVFFKVVVSV